MAGSLPAGARVTGAAQDLFGISILFASVHSLVFGLAALGVILLAGDDRVVLAHTEGASTSHTRAANDG